MKRFEADVSRGVQAFSLVWVLLVEVEKGLPTLDLVPLVVHVAGIVVSFLRALFQLGLDVDFLVLLKLDYLRCEPIRRIKGDLVLDLGRWGIF